MKPQDRARVGSAIGASLAVHLGLLLLVLTVLRSPPLDSSEPAVAAARVKYIHVAGVGGGGGGSNQPRVMPTPAVPEQRAERRDMATTPIPPSFSLTATPQPLDLPGTISGLSAPPGASGNPGGSGAQPGRGAGPGIGDGVGPGKGGNTGGEEYAPGDSVTIPEVLVEVRPAYTTEAMRARTQGIVVIEAVVRADGTLARPRIVRSLDPGLDRRAIEAVQQWRFKPGRRRDTNEPVDVRVTIQLTFSLR